MTSVCEHLPEGVNSNCGIYMIRNVKNGKKYIGSTKNFKGRKSEHLRLLKKNRHGCDHLQHAWNKENNPATFECFLFMLCKESELLALEQACFDTMKPEYNSSLIAGRIDFTEQVRSKMRRRKRIFLESPKGKSYLEQSSRETSKRQSEFAKTEEGRCMYAQISDSHQEYARTPEGISSYSIRGRKTSETLRARAETPSGKEQMKALGAHNRELCKTDYGRKMAKERAQKANETKRRNGSQSGINHWTVQHKAAHYFGA